MDNIRTILIGGKAGEGIKKLAQLIGITANHLGLYSFQSDDYQSLIKGGHNFSTVSISTEPLYNCYQKADLVICLDQLSYDIHHTHLTDQGLVYYNQDDAVNMSGIGLPLTSMMKQTYQTNANLSLAGLAVFYAHFGLDQNAMRDLIKTNYKKNIEENLTFADAIFPMVNPSCSLPKPSQNPLVAKLLTGNQAIALGAWLAGLDMYFAYPMTPASSLLHYFASLSDKLGVKSIHAESELAAANMAIGAVVSGARAAIGSSGGGFALMQEAFSMAGIVESPLLCILSSRPGPATGVSTYHAQEDLYFALHQGHGEFSRIVASPDSIECAFSLAAELLNLAWKLQIPCILLTEKHLSESLQSACLDKDRIPEAIALEAADASHYKRYELTDNGISPLKFPPSPEVIKWNSHEHLDNGLRTDSAATMISMKDKRDRKIGAIYDACSQLESVKVFGSGSKRIFAYGSTALEVREAMRYLNPDYQLIVPIYLEPLPVEKLRFFCSEPAIVVEHNSQPRFAQFLKEKTGLISQANILRYDGRTWDPLELASKIMELDNA